MTDTLLRLADTLTSFTEPDAFAMCLARTPVEQAAVRADLQRLVADGGLRIVGGRFLRARAA